MEILKILFMFERRFWIIRCSIYGLEKIVFVIIVLHYYVWLSITKDNFYAKAIKRIPVRVKRPEQYSHKIIRGYLQCLELYGQVLLYQLEEFCSQEEVPGNLRA